ncbi:heme exporter protein CcmB [Phenylobacterium sp.]|uniref:heme exporter protein CcmB n=1 Tax=Phenylobacterium sp. TaxID=1871053 RepID=UPI0027319BAB|nr:heme exporter protein CcmB [Phenylobacterium sp.]MDP1617593.1 heme exporter protein CcmB [Phenylobacterium sp.]MDP1987825.1 heme exporter protein CcmB [Phenylobacterium sp.]
MSPIAILLGRETALAWGKGGGPMVAVGFYAGVATLLPLAVGSEPERLAAVAPGAAWVALALAALLSLDRLFERDYEDGALDLLTLSPVPLEIVCAVKCLAQWLATGLPLALAAPVAAIALGASPQLSGLVVACALLGGLAFAFMGGIGAALSLGARRGGLLTAVIVLPLFVPPVIFGGGALARLDAGLPWTAGFALLGAYAAAAVALGPIAMAAACRNALS